MLEDKHGIYADLEDKVVDKEKDIVDDDRNSDQKQHYSL